MPIFNSKCTTDQLTTYWSMPAWRNSCTRYFMNHIVKEVPEVKSSPCCSQRCLKVEEYRKQRGSSFSHFLPQPRCSLGCAYRPASLPGVLPSTLCLLCLHQPGYTCRLHASKWEFSRVKTDFCAKYSHAALEQYPICSIIYMHSALVKA